jgi:methylase of polypeptide subunit release factors
LTLAKGFKTVVGTDIIVPEMTDWRTQGADFVIAEGASCIRNDYFDLVAFNPPYLPIEVRNDPCTEGGAELEVPMKFLREALRVVKKEGRIIMLLNDQAPMAKFEAECSRQGFRVAKVATRHLFFEELCVYEASRA